MTIEYKIITLLIIVAGLIVFSWRSLRDINHHGVYRLLAWICLIVLIFLNLNYWFYMPFSLLQILSWILLIISILMVTYGLIHLHRGKPSDSRTDNMLFGPERTTTLITSGAYKYVRHPIYSSMLFGAWGILLKHITWLGVILAGLTTLFTFITAIKEEHENVDYFGCTYLDYMKKTKRFIPFFF